MFNVHIYMRPAEFRKALRAMSRALSPRGIIVVTTDMTGGGNLSNLTAFDRNLKRVDAQVLYPEGW